MLGNLFRLMIRKIIGVKEHENIKDAIGKKRLWIVKKIYRNEFDLRELKEVILKCGLTEGDTVLVHCSWRQMYNFTGSPKDVIDLLTGIVGEKGTILMPSYGTSRLYFDVDNSPSAAGVLSEEFRKEKGVYRSACTHFSVAAKGLYAQDIISKHEKSEYGFDEFSPCYALWSIPNAKEMFIGLGKKPTKISTLHCAGAFLQSRDIKIQKLLSKKYKSTLVMNGTNYIKDMYIRCDGHGNDNATFRMIYNSLKKKKRMRVSNVDVVIIEIKEAIDTAIEFAQRGYYCYKHMKKIV